MLSGLPLLLAALSVESDSTCPGAEDVRAELQRLRPLQPDGRLVVSARGSELWLELDAAASRSLPAPDDCQARARIVAVVVASWLGELAAPTLRLPEPAPPGWGWAVEVMGGGLWDGRGAGTGSLAVRVLPFRRLSGELGVHAQSVRAVPVAEGLAEYWRIGGSAGLSWLTRLGQSRWAVRFGVAVLPGAFLVRGVGFDLNRTSQGFELGLRGSIQVGAFFNPVEVWLGPFAMAWPAPQGLNVAGQPQGAVPQFEGGIGAAVTLGERFWRRRAWGAR